jgi:septal ring factor EnvC (AmiA/AmiB activator)
MPMKSLPRVSHILLLGVLALALLAAAPTRAADHSELERVERELEASRERAAAVERDRRKAAAELAKLRREAIAAAARAQKHERQLIELEKTLNQLGEREDTARAALRQKQFAMAGTLGALQRLSRNPPQTMLAFPDAPKRMVRSAMLLRAALPRMREDAESLRAGLEEIARIDKDTRLQLASLETASRALEKERERLIGVQRRKARLLKETVSEGRDIDARMRELAGRAKSIRELLARIEEERKRREKEEAERRRREADAPAKPLRDTDVALTRPPGVRPFPIRGTITVPTSAPILRRYGQRNARGVTERGITFATRPLAQIVAPHDGLVAFAGPFEGYGQILIIEHDGGYHTLLAGLDRLDTATGQWVLAGEPVGAMGPSVIDAFGETQGLYLELRRRGQPINPHRWVAQR